MKCTACVDLGMALVLCCTLIMCVFSSTAYAVDGAWASGTSGGSWATDANWVGNAVPGGTGSAIVFPKNTGTVDLTTTLDDGFTVGSLNVDLSGKKWAVDPGIGGSMLLDNGGSMPVLFLTGGGNRLFFRAPVSGAAGWWLTATAGLKPWLEIHGVNTYSGVTLLDRSVNVVAMNASAFGSSRVDLVPSTSGGDDPLLYIEQGLTLTNDFVLASDNTGRRVTLGAYNATGLAEPGDVTLKGTITLKQTSGINQIVSTADGSTALHASRLIIDGNILGDGAATPVSFRGAAVDGRIDLNGTVALIGQPALQDGITLTVNNSFSWLAGQTFNHQGGTLVLGKTNAFDTVEAINFNAYDGGANEIFDLNGYDQRIGGMFNGANQGGISRITSAKPAVLTLDVATGITRNFRYKFRLDGALTILKVGAGTQQFNNATHTNFVSNVIVREGTLQFLAGLDRANVTVEGGTLNGSATLLFKVEGRSVDCLKLTSGTLNIATMPVVIEGEPDFGVYTILDYSGVGASFTPATTATAPFYSVAGLPESCKLIHDSTAKKVYLVKPRQNTVVVIR